MKIRAKRLGNPSLVKQKHKTKYKAAFRESTQFMTWPFIVHYVNH